MSFRDNMRRNPVAHNTGYFIFPLERTAALALCRPLSVFQGDLTFRKQYGHVTRCMEAQPTLNIFKMY
jgi:hypothetical protein